MNEIEHAKAAMNECERQAGILRQIFAEARFSPKFRENPKFEGDAPFIAYDDVMAGRYVIREGDDETIMKSYANKKNRVIASYPNLQALVEDGWELD